MEYIIPRGTQAVMGIPVGKLQNLDARVSALEVNGSGTWYQDEVPSGTKNGSNTAFTLAHAPSKVVFLYLNGQYLVSGTDYTRSGTSITMTVAPLSTDTLIATYS